MTQQEWEDQIEDLYDLRSWCLDNGYFEDTMYDIIDEYELDDSVAEDINNFDGDWTSLRDNLNDINTGYSLYRRDGMFDYVGLDNADYRDMKQEVLDYLIETDYFDTEEEEEEDEGNTSFEPEPQPGPEPVDQEEAESWALDFNIDTIFEIASVNVTVMVDSRPHEQPVADPEPEEDDHIDWSELIELPF